MVTRKIAVLGAAGHIGRVVTETLLGRGHEVRAVCRDHGKLDVLAKLGARPYPIDTDHRIKGLLEAFDGVDAVYAMIPPDYGVDHYLRYMDRVGEHIVGALKQSGTEYVVNLSALGADLHLGTGPLVGLHRQEERLDAIGGLNVMHLRPGFSMENLLYWIPMLRKGDRIGSAFRADLVLEMVAAHDVGWKAADLLDKLEFEGHDFLEVIGPRAYRIDEVALAIGKAIGKPALRYELVDDLVAQKNFVAAGFDPAVAEMFVQLEHAYDDGLVKVLQVPWRGEILLEKFVADTFVPAYRAGL